MILFLKYSSMPQYAFEVYNHIPQLRSGTASNLCNDIPLFPILLPSPMSNSSCLGLPSKMVILIIAFLAIVCICFVPHIVIIKGSKRSLMSFRKPSLEIVVLFLCRHEELACLQAQFRCTRLDHLQKNSVQTSWTSDL